MKNFLSGLLIFFSLATKAQYWVGGSIGNYAGVHTLYHNPSSIADSRYRYNIQLFGFNNYLTNDYLSLKMPYGPFELAFHNVNGLNRYFNVDDAYLDANGNPIFLDEYLVENLNGKGKNLFIQNELRLPAFQININPKNAIAFSSRIRNMVQVTDMTEVLARMLRYGFYQGTTLGGEVDVNTLFTNNKFNLHQLAYAEGAFTYARQIFDLKKHYLKGGLTGKYYVPLSAYYIRNSGTDILLDLDSLLANQNVDVEFRNANLEYGYVSEKYYSSGSLLQNRLGSGSGFDLGFTYEYRPFYKLHQYRMDGADRWDPTENKYLIRIAASVNDIGSIRLNNADYVRANILPENSKFRWDSTTSAVFEDIESQFADNGAFATVDTLINRLIGFEQVNNNFTLKTPAFLNLNVDYRAYKWFYVNLIYIQALRRREATGIRGFSLAGVTPRFETRFFDAGFPILFTNDFRKLRLGSNLRIGPFFIGSDDLNVLFKKREKSGLDLYFGFSYGLIRKKLKDRDKDAVSDRRDFCIDVPGVWELRGCPDSDGDGIEDRIDECPYAKGEARYFGCPDGDGDGIPDKEDACPNEFGLAQFNGCPDRDGDGIPDKADDCPDEKGLAQFKGCPDKDTDGIPDKDDKCPDLAGPAETKGCPDKDGDGVYDPIDECAETPGLAHFNGCPDSDGDGIPDHKDKCPNEAGLTQFKGCPDTDGDGLADFEDLCPMQPGTLENNGCPVVMEQIELLEVTKEEEQLLREVFDNLEFNVGSSVIRDESFVSLKELAVLLSIKKPYNLYIAGHTDNKGNKAKNTLLSKERAEAVKKYLVAEGIEAERIKTEGYGPERPVAENKTEAGRQKNRRVEFRLIK
jgi:outer membrane protein OmpA-like peptidoglycan-associated protein